MDCQKKNIIIVFHSYPKGPCIDGLISCHIASELFKGGKLSFIPYWRTDECFQNIKREVENLGFTNTMLVYADCSPELENEVNFLTANLEKFISVKVYDHHPVSKDSPLNKLIGLTSLDSQEVGLKKFEFVFDADHCASLILYNLLSNKEKEKLDMSNLITMLQFSEYLGMNSQLAGEEAANIISKDAMKRATDLNKSLKDNFDLIADMKISAYYILDQLMPDKSSFNFLYSPSIGMKERTQLVGTALKEYASQAQSIMNGSNGKCYSLDVTRAYIDLVQEMQTKLAEGYILQAKDIGGKKSNVFVVVIDIFKYGRTLELYVKRKLEEKGAAYAVLMNPSTINSAGQEMFYYSLRRVNKEYDARDMVNYVKEITGSKIGGGHPWACGVTLNESQNKKFLEEK